MPLENANRKLKASVVINLREKKSNKHKSSKHYLLIWSNNTSVNNVVLTVMCAITSHGGGEDWRRPDCALQDPRRSKAAVLRSVSAPRVLVYGNQWVAVTARWYGASKVTS